jgi:hypothetical protein
VKARIFGAAVLAACAGGAIVVYASDLVGVYAVVEKVVLEPSDASPERAQVWGAFAVYDQGSGSTYQSPQRGYLYFTCPQGKESVCRKEWADLKSVAGKETGVGFGRRWEPVGRIRKADEKAGAPDPYPIQMGVLKVEKASDRGAQTLQTIEGLRQALKQR